jgi:hypothetical protein
MRRITIFFCLVLAAAVILGATAERFVNSPQRTRRDPSARLLLLDLQGPSTVAANSAERYALIARYTDGTAVDVTDRAEWSVDSPYARVDRGVLTVAELPGVHSMTVTAWFADGLSLKASLPLRRKGPWQGPEPGTNDPGGLFSVGTAGARVGRGADG